MTAEEHIAQLETELVEERAKNAMLQAELVAQRAETTSAQEENAQLRQQMEQIVTRLREVEKRLAKDSRNSSKPPSSDGPGRRPRSQRKASGKKTGGQPGHPGRTLMQVASPDEVVRHRPAECVHCQQALVGVVGKVKERRQVHDLPEVRLVVREHQVEEVRCPICQCLSEGTFPAGVKAPAQYGPNVRALAVYLHQYQLVPLGRTCEVLADLCDCQVSEGALTVWVQQAAETLEETVAQIADWLSASRLQHGDETGVRIGGKLHWIHVNSTRWLTHLAWHAKRGKQALEVIGIWPRFHGRAMHDRWTSYDQYACAHSVCAAHLLRDCTAVLEQEQQSWAGEMHDLLLSMAAAADEWRQRGATAVPTDERDEWVAQYFDLLGSGFAAQPSPEAEQVPKRRGRQKQSAAKNLLDDLLRRANQVLAFLDDLSIPFTNNQAERDLRMIKVQQKIAGTFRSATGATAFCRIRSYLSTMRKQGHRMLAALAAVFAGRPLPVAWEPG
jgi:transposase